MMHLYMNDMIKMMNIDKTYSIIFVYIFLSIIIWIFKILYNQLKLRILDITLTK